MAGGISHTNTSFYLTTRAEYLNSTRTTTGKSGAELKAWRKSTAVGRNRGVVGQYGARKKRGKGLKENSEVNHSDLLAVCHLNMCVH